MHEITIDTFKLFILDYNRGHQTGLAKQFAKEFKTKNAPLLEIDDDAEAIEYIFKRYLLH